MFVRRYRNFQITRIERIGIQIELFLDWLRFSVWGFLIAVVRNAYWRSLKITLWWPFMEGCLYWKIFGKKEFVKGFELVVL